MDERQFWETPFRHKYKISYGSLRYFDELNKIKGAEEKYESHWKHGITIKEFR